VNGEKSLEGNTNAESFPAPNGNTNDACQDVPTKQVSFAPDNQYGYTHL